MVSLISESGFDWQPEINNPDAGVGVVDSILFVSNPRQTYTGSINETLFLFKPTSCKKERMLREIAVFSAFMLQIQNR